ncbi:MAG TPA: glycosyltransferase [Candidatus Polarisedimenticolia bacterium]|nr:glycosyltransferase [Candidatus Polarisedimenticolia bacterium]
MTLARDDQALRCAVGVMAYNEERNLGRLLEALRTQELSRCRIDSIIVVASGCTDRTEPIAEQAASVDSRVHLIRQARREGKSSAINLFLKTARASGVDVCVLQSGDTLPEAGTIEALVRPMAEDPGIGMTGAHVVPVNSEGTLLGRIVRVLWKLHHRLAMEVPKMGELIAFRNLIASIPEDSAVDEVSVESAITRAGLALRYAPDAIVLNKGPETVSDFLKQRRRIHAGHLDVKRKAGYAPSTMSLPRVARVFAAEVAASPSSAPAAAGAAALEAVGRALGAWDFYVAHRNHTVWDIAVTTKNVEGH